MVISLGWLSPATSRGLPAARTTRAGSRCLLGLAPTGGYRAAPVARRAVGSYPTFSPLPLDKGPSVFCGPFRRLAEPRRYLAVCPLGLGCEQEERPVRQGEPFEQAERKPIRRRLRETEREVDIAPLPQDAVPERSGALRHFVLQGPIVERQQPGFAQRRITGSVRQRIERGAAAAQLDQAASPRRVAELLAHAVATPARTRGSGRIAEGIAQIEPERDHQGSLVRGESPERLGRGSEPAGPQRRVEHARSRQRLTAGTA